MWFCLVTKRNVKQWHPMCCNLMKSNAYNAFPKPVWWKYLNLKIIGILRMKPDIAYFSSWHVRSMVRLKLRIRLHSICISKLFMILWTLIFALQQPCPTSDILPLPHHQVDYQSISQETQAVLQCLTLPALILHWANQCRI